jgi:NADH:ubiquinone oxidoreductase subunit 6 (subunit J)
MNSILVLVGAIFLAIGVAIIVDAVINAVTLVCHAGWVGYVADGFISFMLILIGLALILMGKSETKQSTSNTSPTKQRSAGNSGKVC